MNDNIKIINFNKNKLNNNSSELNEIIFNNNNQINNNFFNNNKENIVIEENIALNEKDLVYKDDSIYIQELENEFLSKYPVTKQNNKYIVEKIQSEAKVFIELKNSGINRYNLLKKKIDYKKKLDIINNDFSDSWIIPIVYDKHIIFSNIIDKTKNEDDNNENINGKRILTQLRENLSGANEIDQKDLIIKLNEKNNNFEEGKINLINYEEINSSLYNSYDTRYNENSIENKGFLIHPKKSFNVLRYTDLQSNYWDIHKILNDYDTPTNIYDEDGKIIGIEKDTLIKCDDQNIYGFLVLKEGNKNILRDYKDILYGETYKNNLYQVLYDKKSIEKIVQNEKNFIRITINDHNLSNDSIICLKNTDCYPKIDGFYDNNGEFKIIDKDNIEIKTNKNLIFEGSKGNLYILSKLKYDYYNVNDDLSLEFKFTNYENNQEKNNHNKLYIFEDVMINN